MFYAGGSVGECREEEKTKGQSEAIAEQDGIELIIPAKLINNICRKEGY
jgi:hypothetical protein